MEKRSERVSKGRFTNEVQVRTRAVIVALSQKSRVAADVHLTVNAVATNAVLLLIKHQPQRALVLKQIISLQLRKYLRKGFNVLGGGLHGPRAMRSTEQNLDDNFARFGANLSWTDIPPGQFFG